MVRKRVAVALAQRPRGRRPDMREDEGACRLLREAGEVRAVPGGRRAGEDARPGAELGVRVVPDAEAVAVVRALVLWGGG